MVDRRDDQRENFIINEDESEKSEELHRKEYYESASDVFRKMPLVPFVVGGVALAAVVITLVVILSRPDNVVDPAHLQSLDTRLQQIENKMATIGVVDQTVERLANQEKELGRIGNKLDQLESTVTTQIDQIIRELGAIQQKLARNPASKTPPQKAAGNKSPAAAGKTNTAVGIHQVQAGDTLYRISRKYGLTVEQLRSYNELAPDAAIYPGQSLRLSPR